jgi:hypothetical protein
MFWTATTVVLPDDVFDVDSPKRRKSKVLLARNVGRAEGMAELGADRAAFKLS